MLRVQINYTVDPCHIDAIKTGASRYLPYIQPAIRMEVCARALGFNTWAALIVSDMTRRCLNIKEACDFAITRGIQCNPLDLHFVMAEATTIRIAAIMPELHSCGLHSRYFEPAEDDLKLYKDSAPEAALISKVDPRLSVIRDALQAIIFSGATADQALRALAYFSSQTASDEVGPSAPTSYGVKHSAERLSYDLGDGLILKPDYVANADAIVAAIDCGFPIIYNDELAPNALIGIASSRSDGANLIPSRRI